MLAIAFWLSVHLSLAFAQTITVPSTWTNASSHFTRQERIALAQGAVSQLVSHGFPSGSVAQLAASVGSNSSDASWDDVMTALQVLGVVVRKDHVTGTLDNEAFVAGQLGALSQNSSWLYPSMSSGNVMFEVLQSYQTDLAMVYAMSCLDAYLAYGGNQYVATATELWSHIQSTQVTDQNVAQGSHDSIPFNPECNGVSVAGAVPLAWPSPGQPSVDQRHVVSSAQDIMRFAGISAQLAALNDGNDTFVEAASAAVNFWQTVLVAFPPRAGCTAALVDLSNYVDPKSCLDSPATIMQGTGLNMACSTYFAEGGFALSNVTRNTSMQNMIASQMSTLLLSQTIPADGVMNENVTYGPRTGVLTPGNISSNYDFMFSIPKIWQASLEQALDLVTLLEAFTNVQLNALMSKATVPGSNIYGPDWAGPSATGYTTRGMVSAAAALVASIGPNQPQPPKHSSLSHGAIAGISMTAGILALLSVCLVLRLCRKPEAQAPAVEPFDAGPPLDQTVIASTGEKETTMFWRDRGPTVPLYTHVTQGQGSPSSLSRAFWRKRAGPPQRTTVDNGEPSSTPVDVDQLVQRVQALSTGPGTPGDDLRQRLEELGPIPEVLRALQEILSSGDGSGSGHLPQYEEQIGSSQEVIDDRSLGTIIGPQPSLNNV